MDWNEAEKIVDNLSGHYSPKPHRHNFFCDACVTWYAREDVPFHGWQRDKNGCFGKCECGGDIFDAHEVGTPTPIEQWIIDHLKHVLRDYENKCYEIEKLLKRY
jgi:hypothetical protein